MAISLRRSVAVLAIAATATFGLAACSSGSSEPTNSESAIGGDIVAPLELNYGEIAGQTITMSVGQALNINYGDVDPATVNVVIADPMVAEYTGPKTEGDAEFSAGITALSGGTTKVDFESNGGATELTIEVLLK